jgi:hypothetical protein
VKRIKVKLLENNINPSLPSYYKDNYILYLLRHIYDVEIVNDNPDILIYPLSHNGHLNYKCFKIFYTEEPGFWNKNNFFNFYPKNDRFYLSVSDADIVISSYYINNEKNIRIPSYLLYYYQMLMDGRIKNIEEFFQYKINTDKNLANRKFCVYMHRKNSSNDKFFRFKFFQKLSKYKEVDICNVNGGSYEKTEFIKSYKFCFSMENNSNDIILYPTINNTNKYMDIGYTTEKIIEPFVSNVVPIYWGNPLIYKEFNTNMFLNWHDYNDDDALIKEIIKIDNDKELYMKYLNGKILNKDFYDNFKNDILTKMKKLIDEKI